jgi:hypothetical protein
MRPSSGTAVATGRWLLAPPAMAATILLAGCSGSAGTAAPATTTPASPSAASSSGGRAPAGSPSATAARPVKVPACATSVSDPAEGYQVKLPCGFTRVTSQAQLDSIMKQAAAQLKGKVGDSAQLGQAKLSAANAKTGSRINLVITPADGMTGKDLSSQKAALKQQLESIGANSLTFSDLTVAGDQALRVKATMVTKSAKLQMVQVYTIHSDKAYIWTFTGAKAMQPEEQLVLGTLTFS